MTKLRLCLLLVSITAFFCSCSPTKHLSKEGVLLSKNKVECDSKLIDASDLNKLIKQDPNNKFLGIKWGMYFYSLSEVGNDSTVNFFSRNVFRRLGSKPVELNYNLVRRSSADMKTFLQSKGVFNANIIDSLAPVRRPYAPWSFYNRRKKVIYKVDIPSRYKINQFTLAIEDSIIKAKVEKITAESPIKTGNYYDEEVLGDLRKTINDKLRLSGYYAFSEKYIQFIIDTNLNCNCLNIELQVTNPLVKQNDTVVEAKHKPYKIRDIYVYPDYYPATSSYHMPILDTAKYFHKSHKSSRLSKFLFIRSEISSIKPKPIMRSILLQNGDLFSPLIAQSTRNALSQLKNFKFIDISFTPDNNSKADTLPLDCLIRLSMAKPINLTTSFEMNFSAVNNSINLQESSSLGSEFNIGFSHNNLFKGAEIFTTNIKTAAEVRSDIFSSNKDADLWNWFNAFELGFDMGIELPRFLAPFSTSFYSMRFRPHTSIKLAYNIQKRTYYDRRISTLNYEYSWQTNPANSFFLIPIEVNFVDMEITSEEYASLIATLDKRIQYQMSDHLVMDARFGFVHNGQATSKTGDFNYLRTNVETAGNLLYLISHLINQTPNAQNQYEVLGIPYSQYVRGDFDFVHYHTIGEKSKFVSRIFAGAGWYYGNARSLPYEKSFFAGGANNIRAWQLRELGPGSSKSENQYDKTQTGDMTLGMNLEYRFPIFSVLEGAGFIDAGNIWTWQDQSSKQGSKFEIADFYKEIAVGAGFGLRLNIEFLILRIDVAAKVWNPAMEESKRFVLPNTKFKDLQVQFGIGYPF
jgi:outer membrane protein assembly factor BamA